MTQMTQMTQVSISYARASTTEGPTAFSTSPMRWTMPTDFFRWSESER